LMPPRLLTSGMVRRTPSRQPIKSLDLEPSTSRGAHLQANDRVLSYTSGAERYDVGKGLRPGEMSESAREGGSQWPKVQGVDDLMAFHSGQSTARESRSGSDLTTLGTTDFGLSRSLRQKVCMYGSNGLL
jgi:hypothetical protein